MSLFSRIFQSLTGRRVSAYCLPEPPFKLGVASGEPYPDSVVLWTRLAPEPQNDDPKTPGGMPPDPVAVQWEVAEDENFGKVVARGETTAVAEFAHSVHVEVPGLAPGHEYFYRFKSGPEISPVGRTKTAPSGSVSQVRFAIASCQQWEHGWFTAYKHMAAEGLDVICHLGDYIYEYGRAQYPAPDGAVRYHDTPEIMTLPRYRHRYALYRTDPDLQAAHASAPWIVTWDDHEVENNYADEVSEDKDNVDWFLRRRGAAYRAYYENMPLRRASLPSGPDMRLYRRLRYGDLLDFLVLDTRQYRDDQAAGDGIKPPSAEQADPKRTLTGAEQEKWLIESLADPATRWKMVAQQVFFSQLDMARATGKTFMMDTWDGYLGSRNRIMKAITDRKVRNPVVLTGDIHSAWAAEIKANFNDPSSKTLGVELVCTSISSDGNGSDKRQDTDKILARNPHVKFFNAFRGYTKCTVTPAELRADFQVVTKVTTQDAPLHTRASFRVKDGQPGLEKIADNPPADGRAISEETELSRISAQQAHK